jgi:hypothetical protein
MTLLGTAGKILRFALRPGDCTELWDVAPHLLLATSVFNMEAEKISRAKTHNNEQNPNLGRKNQVFGRSCIPSKYVALKNLNAT